MFDGTAQGYIEGKVGRTKSAYTTRYLPMVAPLHHAVSLGLIGSLLGERLVSGVESREVKPCPCFRSLRRLVRPRPLGAGEGAD